MSSLPLSGSRRVDRSHEVPMKAAVCLWRRQDVKNGAGKQIALEERITF
jgi:hypothetical protein